jgi:copper resistance protein C
MPPKGRRVVAFVACAAVTALALAPGRAAAHTQLDFSLPANGTTVGEPVSEISVGFTDVVALVGNGFEVHDPQGNVLTPFVVTDDSKVFRFQLDPPLAGGVVVVDYHVRALDGDVQEGSFGFTVAAPPATTSIVSPTTNTPTTATAAPTTTATTTTTTTATTTTTTTATTIRPPGDSGPASDTPGTGVESALGIDGSDSDGDRERTLTFGVLLAIVAAAGGFLVVRSRRTA